jgi:hypothetical protein
VASLQDGEATLKSDTEGANIGYQVLGAGEEPGEVWEVYTGPVSVEPDKHLVAVAHRIGYKPSEPIEVTASE